MDLAFPPRRLAARKPAGSSAPSHGPDPLDKRIGLTAVSGGRRYGVLRLGHDEIVVDTDGTQPMRGIVDLFAQGQRVGRLLVQLVWSENGRSGYELKRRTLRMPSAAVPHGARSAAALPQGGGMVRAAEAP
ncbi:MAG: hypothetical protein AAF899_09745 [Pseudomonadota bacterium]